MSRTLQDRLSALKDDSRLVGLRRSLEVYYGDSARDAAMDALYSRFVGPGDLAFDIGSHVGDRIGAFGRLGARVVALEPQPDCALVIRTLYGDDSEVTLIEAACGREPGRIVLHVNSANPTVTTASVDFIAAAEGAGGWEGQVWDCEIEAEVTTLNDLVGRFGRPRFVKIDVEGFEGDVLAGLSESLPALSFEFTTIQRDIAIRCVDRLQELGPYRFDAALGETQVLRLGEWVSGPRIKDFIQSLPHEANSGDIYACLD